MAEKTYNEKGQMIYVDEDGNDVTQETSLENQKESDEELKKKKKKKSIFSGGRAPSPEVVAAAKENGIEYKPSGIFSESVKAVKTEPKEKELPEGSSSGTDTIPLPQEVQEKIDTSNDATRQEKEQIKKASDEAHEYIKKNDVSDVAKDAMLKYGLNTTFIDTNYTKGLPRSIWKSWQDGKFGNPKSKDAKAVRNYLMMNELGTSLANMGAVVKGGEKKEGLWTSSVRKNMEEADNRNNDKFKNDMNNQMQMLNLGAEDQIELNKYVNQIMADNTLAIAAKHAGNIEDTIGLWYLKEALGSRWASMSGEKKMAMLSAITAMQNGDAPSAQALMTAYFDPKETAEIARQVTINQGKQSDAQTKLQQIQAKYGEANAIADTTGKYIKPLTDVISLGVPK